MDVVQVGLDHLLAPIEVRERLAMDAPTIESVIRDVHALPWADEVLVLSTCNRTELYAVSAMRGAAELVLGAMLEHVPHAPDPDDVGYRQQSGEAAAQHLLRVAAGLESAIIGETEIQGQVKAAYARSRTLGATGPVLERLCQSSLRAGKRARTETAIAAGGVSHGSAAVEVVGRIFGRLGGRTVLVVGAGTIATQAARAFAAAEGARFVVANRTAARAETLAADLPRAKTAPLDAVPHLLERAHVALFATGAAPLPATVVARAAGRRRDPLLIVDMGMPRCVEAAVTDLPGVFLYDLEDLEHLVADALASRREAVPAVESIVADEFERFRAWYKTLSALPAIRSLKAWADGIREEELAHLREALPPELAPQIERLTRRLVRRLLGRPTQRVVKGAEASDPSLPTAEHLRHVFGLDEDATRRDDE